MSGPPPILLGYKQGKRDHVRDMGKRHSIDKPRGEASGETDLTYTLILDFKPPEL